MEREERNGGGRGGGGKEEGEVGREREEEERRRERGKGRGRKGTILPIRREFGTLSIDRISTIDVVRQLQLQLQRISK